MKITSLLFIGLIMSLSACSHLNSGTQTQQQSKSSAQSGCEKATNAETSMNLDMIEQLIASGRMHAALAHLDNLQLNSLHATYLRAEALRQSGREKEAAEQYEMLLSTCMVGEAHHGLGLIAGRNNLINKAVDHLTLAANNLPVNARVRNDLGYAFLLQGEYGKAQREFVTALELDQNEQLAETNMMILFLVKDEREKAKSFAKRINMDAQTVADLNAQALTLRAQARTR